MKKRIFPRNKAVIFMLNILLISIIVGLFSSVISGIGTRQFYVNNDSNVITITNPDVKTPAVSYIPNSLTNVFAGMKGVTAISPEIYSLILINNKPATLHGITANFTKLVQIESYSGVNFINITNKELNLGIYAGKSIANELGLKIGSNYLIYSTISDSFVSFKLLGIISFKSFYNEELFTSMANSNFFRPTTGRNDVSMIRIKYNQEILSTSTISNMINSRHQVLMQFKNKNSNGKGLNGIRVTVTTIDGYYVDSELSDYNGQTGFNLLLGDYVFQVSYGSTSYSFEKIVYSSTTIPFNIGDNYNPLSYDQNNNNLTVNAFNNGQRVNNAKIELIDQYGNINSSLSGNNQYYFNYLPKGNYTLLAEWNGEKVDKTIALENTTEININFTQKVQLFVKTPNNISINNFSCSIYNYSNKTTLNINNCSQAIYLPKSVYNITVKDPLFGNFSKIIVVNDYPTSQNINFIIGSIQTNFTVYQSKGILYANQLVYAKSINNDTFVFEGKTNSFGQITMDFPFGSEHILYFNGSKSNNQIYYKSVVNENQTVILSNEKKLTLYIFNGSLGENSPISNVNVEVKTLNNTIYSGLTNQTGYTSFKIKTDDILKITLASSIFKKSFVLNSYQNDAILKYSLGENHIVFVMKNNYGATVKGVSITSISSTGNQTFETNQNGVKEFYFNTSNSQNFLEKNGIFTETRNILYNLPLSYLEQFFYIFSIKFNNISKEIVIPKSFFSNYTTENVLTPYIFIASFKVVNAFNAAVKQAVIKLTSQKLHSSIILVTDNNGKSTGQLFADGSYSMVITNNGKQFTYQLDVSLDKSSYTIQILDIGSSVTINNNLGGPYSALSSKQYLDNFYNTTTTFFIQLALILLLVVVIILIFLFSSAILLTFESLQKEIAIFQIIGGTNYQISWNILSQLSIRGIGASIFGYLIGFLITIIFPSLNNVQLIGFIIIPSFNITFFLISIITVNILNIFTLVRQLRNFNWKTPLKNIKF